MPGAGHCRYLININSFYSQDSKDWLAWDRLSSRVKMRLLRGGTGKGKGGEEGRGGGPLEDLSVVFPPAERASALNKLE